MVQKRNLQKSEHGQSLVEFSLSMVLVLVLLTGLVDLGRTAFTYMSLREAAQEGATYASINPSMTDSVQDRVFGSSNMLQTLKDEYGESAPIDVEVNIDEDACMGNSIEVVVTYNDYPMTMPFVGTMLGKQAVDISASAMDSILSPACD